MSRCICSVCLGSLTEDPTGNSDDGPNAKMAKPSDPAQTIQLVSTRCGHIFHRSCLTTWLTAGNNICPSCRETCGAKALKPVFLSTSQSSSSTASASSTTEPSTSASSTAEPSTAEPSTSASSTAEPSTSASSTSEPSTSASSTSLQPLRRLIRAADEHESLLEDLDEIQDERRALQRRHAILIDAHDTAQREISKHQLSVLQLEASKKDLTNKLDLETEVHKEVKKELDQKHKKISDLIVDQLKLKKKEGKDRSLQTKEPQSDDNELDEDDGDGDNVDEDYDPDKLTRDPVIDDDEDE